ncbi:cytochrome c oxidase subunit II [Sphingomonas sp. 3P27F8]|uniref:cytochrome c oxidase subunit II n=1 Tax=Sphingomonas sp. 3P27F8 TaxID=2502213 RepID=UPI0010F7E9E8|nr:cytochrome c oxidase subunit II [Sphingomonas sp. 3P27F8]
MNRAWGLAGCLALGGCSGANSVLAPAGYQAHALLDVLKLTVFVGAAMYVLVLAFLTLGIVRRRVQESGDLPVVEPADAGLHRGLIAWSVLILCGLSLLITASFVLDRHLAAAQPSETLEVRVTAQQWWWRFVYRDPATGRWVETANELHLPVGRTVRVTLGSNDVIHSFWVPSLAGKMDVIPGRVNVLDLTPRRLGWFRGQCAEFCGVQHAHMAFDVKVESEADFRAWLANQARPAVSPSGVDAARGMRIVSTQCAACHTVRGTAAAGRAGPDLTHLGARRRMAAGTLALNRGNIEGWILQPQSIKPGTLMPATSLDSRGAEAVARYLEALK